MSEVKTIIENEAFKMYPVEKVADYEIGSGGKLGKRVYVDANESARLIFAAGMLHAVNTFKLNVIEGNKIKPYILKNSFYHYLHIRGGSGNPKNKDERYLFGGEYNFILFYASPQLMANKGECCARIWCIEKKIPYGIGDTIAEAYENYNNNSTHAQ